MSRNHLCTAEFLSYLSGTKKVLPAECYDRILTLAKEYHEGKIPKAQFNKMVNRLSSPYCVLIEKNLVNNVVDSMVNSKMPKKKMKEQPHLRAFIINRIVKKNTMRSLITESIVNKASRAI